MKTTMAERAELQLAPDMAVIEPAMRCERLERGDRLRTSLRVTPDRCYAVLAHSVRGVESLELVLWADASPSTQSSLRLVADTVLAQEDGAMAAIGVGEQCYRFDLVPGWTEPIPAVAEVKVTSGAGWVALATYEGPVPSK